eukprot:scaffold114328_cov54-Phaeocystis_antarctica.AAC.2
MHILYRHGAWAEADYGPLEAEFLKKLKAIEGMVRCRPPPPTLTRSRPRRSPSRRSREAPSERPWVGVGPVV